MGKWLYRLESKDPHNGLWYDSYNNLVWGIGKIPNCMTKNLPMGYDPKYHRNGRNWYSSFSNLDDLRYFFTQEDILTLFDNGFVVTKYLATEYEEYERETVFIKETSLARVEIDIKEIWH